MSRTRRPSHVLRAIGLAAALALLASGCIWSSFRGGSDRTGISPFSRLDPTTLWYLGAAWTATTGGPVVSSPAVQFGRNTVYVGSDDGNLYAFLAVDGSLKWTGPTAGPVRSSPAIAGNLVVVGSDDGDVYAFDADGATGCAGDPVVCDPIWSTTIGGAISSSPAVEAGLVYIGSGGGTLFALDVDDGTIAWSADAACVGGGSTTCSMATPAVAGGVVYVGSDEGEGLDETGTLHAFDAATGAPQWATPSGIVQSAPVVANGKVYVNTATIDQVAPEVATDTLRAFDAATGTVLFDAPTGGGRALASPTLIRRANDPVYPQGLITAVAAGGLGGVFDAAGAVDCSGVPLVCGAIRVTQSGAPHVPSSAVGAGVVVGPTADGTLDLYDAVNETNCAAPPALCEPTRSLPLGAPSSSSPAVAGSWVFVGTDAGELRAFRLFHPGPG